MFFRTSKQWVPTRTSEEPPDKLIHPHFMPTTCPGCGRSTGIPLLVVLDKTDYSCENCRTCYAISQQFKERGRELSQPSGWLYKLGLKKAQWEFAGVDSGKKEAVRGICPYCGLQHTWYEDSWLYCLHSDFSTRPCYNCGRAYPLSERLTREIQSRWDAYLREDKQKQQEEQQRAEHQRQLQELEARRRQALAEEAERFRRAAEERRRIAAEQEERRRQEEQARAEQERQAAWERAYKLRECACGKVSPAYLRGGCPFCGSTAALKLIAAESVPGPAARQTGPADADVQPLVKRLNWHIAHGDFVGVGNLILETLMWPGQEERPDAACRFLADGAHAILRRRYGLPTAVTFGRPHTDELIPGDKRGDWQADLFPELLITAYVLGATRVNLLPPHDRLVPYYQLLAGRQRAVLEAAAHVCKSRTDADRAAEAGRLRREREARMQAEIAAVREEGRRKGIDPDLVEEQIAYIQEQYQQA